MISRMEVLQEGASPIYGSDAIAGVVNIITKQRQDGFQASAQIGGYDRATASPRTTTSPGAPPRAAPSIVVGGGYFKQDPVFAADRAISRFPAPFGTRACDGGCSSGTPLGRFIVTDPNTHTRPRHHPAPGAAARPAADLQPGRSHRRRRQLQALHHRRPLQLPAVQLHPDAAGADQPVRLGEPGHHRPRSASAPAPPTCSASRRTRRRRCRCSSVRTPATATCSTPSTSTPPTPTTPSASPCSQGTYSVRRPPSGRGRTAPLRADRRHLERHRHAGWRVRGRPATAWHWDVNAVWSRNHADQTFTGNVNAQRVQQALGPVVRLHRRLRAAEHLRRRRHHHPGHAGLHRLHPAGHLRSRNCATYTRQPDRRPLRPAGRPAGLRRRAWSIAATEGYFQPDAIVAAGLSSDIPAQPANGSITVKEAYAELRVPLIKDMPFFYRLDASLAGRWFDYSTSGSDSTYKAGLTWKPVEEVLLRGSWGQGFRAPSIGELFGAASRFDQVVTDPCSGFSAATPGATSAPTASPAASRPTAATSSSTPQLPVITSGNKNLKPETSESWNFSGVWEPSFLKDASLGQRRFDRGRLHRHQAGRRHPGARTARPCCDRCANTDDALSCATITRTASGAIVGDRQPADQHRRHQDPGAGPQRHLDLAGMVVRPVRRSTGTRRACWSSPSSLPTSTGLATIKREGTERGSPDQAYPKMEVQPHASTGTRPTSAPPATVPLHLRRAGGRRPEQARAPAPTSTPSSAGRPSCLDDGFSVAVGRQQPASTRTRRAASPAA